MSGVSSITPSGGTALVGAVVVSGSAPITVNQNAGQNSFVVGIGALGGVTNINGANGSLSLIQGTGIGIATDTGSGNITISNTGTTGGSVAPVLWNTSDAYAVGVVVNTGANVNSPTASYVCILAVTASSGTNTPPDKTPGNWTPIGPVVFPVPDTIQNSGDTVNVTCKTTGSLVMVASASATLQADDLILIDNTANQPTPLKWTDNPTYTYASLGWKGDKAEPQVDLTLLANQSGSVPTSTQANPVASWASEWVTSRTYGKGNIVVYNAVGYICKQYVVGSTTDPSADTVHWVPLVGGASNWAYRGDFNTTVATVYNLNDVVFDTVTTADTYICILGYTTVVSPGPPVSPLAPSNDAIHWRLFATNNTNLASGGASITLNASGNNGIALATSGSSGALGDISIKANNGKVSITGSDAGNTLSGVNLNAGTTSITLGNTNGTLQSVDTVQIIGGSTGSSTNIIIAPSYNASTMAVGLVVTPTGLYFNGTQITVP
jgi:hypothetical protein